MAAAELRELAPGAGEPVKQQTAEVQQGRSRPEGNPKVDRNRPRSQERREVAAKLGWPAFFSTFPKAFIRTAADLRF